MSLVLENSQISNKGQISAQQSGMSQVDAPIENGQVRNRTSSADIAQASTEFEPDEDGVVEKDYERIFSRYAEEIGTGRFKAVYKAFDEQQGIDVAWSKISSGDQELDPEQVDSIYEEMQRGLNLKHQNIIKCYKCWVQDTVNGQKCINLISELFTSGNLRQYLQQHQQTDSNALKKFAKQILKGLQYLHGQYPVVIHGDLRCDKIYVNGNRGELKIGDLGLSTLIPRRYPEATSQCHDYRKSEYQDIQAFGLCVLEMFSGKQLDLSDVDTYQQYLDSVSDPVIRDLVNQCMVVPDRQDAPTASELLQSSLWKREQPATTQRNSDLGGPSGLPHTMTSQPSQDAAAEEMADGPPVIIRGEDYNFSFQIKKKQCTVNDNRLHFVLEMTETDDPLTPPDQLDSKQERRVSFNYDPAEDSADELATELQSHFTLSDTDTGICAAAIKECLANEMPYEEQDTL